MALATAALAATAASAAARPAVIAACTTGQLQTWLGTPGSGAAGSTYYELELSNVSTTTCSLTGYPVVLAVSGAGAALGSPAAHDTAYPPVTVKLAPGGTAHAVLRVTDTGVLPSCSPVTAAGLQIFPPTRAHALSLPFGFSACSSAGPSYLHIRVIHPGPGIPGRSQ